MNIFVVSAEAVPFAKVGGLADVAGSLPAALREQGIDARLLMPGYGFIPHHEYNIHRLFSFPYSHAKGTTEVNVYSCVYDGVPVYFIQAWPYFGTGHTVYTDWNWDVPRFIFFNQVAMAVAWQLWERLGWFPDVFHVNDWHTSLLPFLLSESKHKHEWSPVASVLSIHNIAYQGDGVGGFLWDAGIPSRHHPLLHEHYLEDNLLGIATAYSDMINTVSPTYANEIQEAYAGYELAPLIRARKDRLVGILNGLDTKRWNPETDNTIFSPFNAHAFVFERAENKLNLQAYAQLPIREDVPLIGVVSRLTWQKGFDLAVPALRELLSEMDVQLVLLGAGEPGIEHQLRQLEDDFRSKSAIFLQFDANLARRIYGGSDMFLMPSHFEPCGIGQMIAMRYGSLPIVRRTGGLADTVMNYDNEDADSGTGFVFQDETPAAVLDTLRWAVTTYAERPRAWRRMQRRAMQQDFSWPTSARQYIDLYRRAVHSRKELAR